jgi:hypothetical protein
MRRQKGNVLLEFALVTPFLMMLLAGSFTLGISLNRSIQAGNVMRTANSLLISDVSLLTDTNKALVMRAAAGLGMNVPGTLNPDPAGKGLLITTKVVRVGPNYCALGSDTWNGDPANCPNYGQYVMWWRFCFGNTSRGTSVLGNGSDGFFGDGCSFGISESQIFNDTSYRATGFTGANPLVPGGLVLDQVVSVSEIFLDVSELNMLPWMAAPNIRLRAVD